MRYRSHRPDPILPLLVLAGTAVLAFSFLRDSRLGRGRAQPRGASSGAGTMAAIHPKVAEGTEDLDCSTFVRPAGPEAMRDRPRRGWDQVDEQVDESFPASDPPGNY